MSRPVVERLAAPTAADLDGLSTLLVACVADGASVGFLAPLAESEARGWWERVLADPLALTWVARDGDGAVVGCVRLLPDPMPNSPHRADVSKLLVAPWSRRQGTAGALMAALEAAALEHGRTLLVLDTETGSDAQHFYGGHGWVEVGDVPGFALTPSGGPSGTTIYYKVLPPPR